MQKGISSASQVADSHSWRLDSTLERELIISENLTPQPSAIEQPVALRALPRNVWAVTVTSFLTDISGEMIVNLLPLFLANVLGVHTALIGLIEGIAETTASLLKAFSGWLSDRLGGRKWLAVSGYAISTVAKPFLYPAASWLAVLAVRFADRLGKGIRTAPRDALVADSIDEGRRGLAFGLHRAGDTAGAFLGLVIALVVVWRAQAGALLLARPAFQRLVLLSIVPAALAVLVLALASREVSRPGRQVARPCLSLAGFDTRFRRFLPVIVLFALGNSADAFLILRAQERGLNILGVLGMLATFNLVYAAISGPAGALSDRVGRRTLIIGGWLTAFSILALPSPATPGRSGFSMPFTASTTVPSREPPVPTWPISSSRTGAGPPTASITRPSASLRCPPASSRGFYGRASPAGPALARPLPFSSAPPWPSSPSASLSPGPPRAPAGLEGPQPGPSASFHARAHRSPGLTPAAGR
jgi:MFS family permease